jgi:hypothetical protein
MIGGLRLAVDAKGLDLPMHISGPTARFVTPWEDTPADAAIRVGWLDEAAPPPEPTELLFASGGMWTLYRAAGGYRYDIATPVFGPEPYRIAWFDPAYQTGCIWYRRLPAVIAAMQSPLEYPVDELLVTNLLARGRGVELHACAVVDTDGRGFLFVGQSGDGKTTTARLWTPTGATVLSDDRVIVRQCDGQWLMFGTPWHGEGEFAAPAAAPLNALFILCKGAEDAARPLTPGLAAARLFARAFPPFYDAAALDFTAGFLERLVTAVPCYELVFRPTPAVVDYVRRMQP